MSKFTIPVAMLVLITALSGCATKPASQTPIAIESKEAIVPDGVMTDCPIALAGIPVTEEMWNTLSLEEQVAILKDDQKFLITEYKKCAIKHNGLVEWHIHQWK